MRALLAATILAVTVTPAFAALSGYWESSKVIHTIIGSDNVANALKQQPIESITQTENGYRIASRDCRVEVRVNRAKSGMPGPGKFSLAVGKGRCG